MAESREIGVGVSHVISLWHSGRWGGGSRAFSRSKCFPHEYARQPGKREKGGKKKERKKRGAAYVPHERTTCFPLAFCELGFVVVDITRSEGRTAGPTNEIISLGSIKYKLTAFSTDLNFLRVFFLNVLLLHATKSINITSRTFPAAHQR